MFYLWSLQSYITAFRGSHGSSCELMNAFSFCFHRHWHHPQPRQFNVVAQLGLIPFSGAFSLLVPLKTTAQSNDFPPGTPWWCGLRARKCPVCWTPLQLVTITKNPHLLMLRSILWSYKVAGFKIPLLQRHVRAVRKLAAWLHRTCPLHCKS